MSFCVIVPARYASTRLPGKLLKTINGKPLLQLVYEQAVRSDAEKVLIATDDERIRTVASEFGAQVYMTSSTHTSGTQRIHEIVEKLNMDNDAIVVNLQGDEPLMPIECINQVADLLHRHQHADMATLCTPLAHQDEIYDSNVVKVVTNKHQQALYFSRATIPWYREEFKSGKADIRQLPLLRRHIGLYAYRVAYIKQYQQLSSSPLEQVELLEQLRVLWHGGSIVVEDAIKIPGPGVDTQSDLDKVIELLSSA